MSYYLLRYFLLLNQAQAFENVWRDFMKDFGMIE